ncbi:hypothetical protein [Bradyrhizobium sp. WSM1743]|uniref:hypothetical protein n=1 Tax=Bradyrhizobium sp. WSM1743 TaxID=318996 RepID=UPI0018DE52AB|nr:hypothetical protein [Bradyrhizobium sp. WSM1743]
MKFAQPVSAIPTPHKQELDFFDDWWSAKRGAITDQLLLAIASASSAAMAVVEGGKLARC